MRQESRRLHARFIEREQLPNFLSSTECQVCRTAEDTVQSQISARKIKKCAKLHCYLGQLHKLGRHKKRFESCIHVLFLRYLSFFTHHCCRTSLITDKNLLLPRQENVRMFRKKVVQSTQ